MNFFQLVDFGFFTKEVQIFFILFLFIATVLSRYSRINDLSSKEKDHANNFAHFFAPIYEEIIFRGVIFTTFLVWYSFWQALLFSSVIFGLWHLKNIFILGPRKTLFQILYAGLFFSPIVCVLSYYLHTIWIGVIVHYLNNLWSVYQWKFYSVLGLQKKLKSLKNYV